MDTTPDSTESQSQAKPQFTVSKNKETQLSEDTRYTIHDKNPLISSAIHGDGVLSAHIKDSDRVSCIAKTHSTPVVPMWVAAKRKPKTPLIAGMPATGRFGLLAGDAGAGKSTWCRLKCIEAARKGMHIAYFLGDQDPEDFVESLLELGVELTPDDQRRIALIPFEDSERFGNLNDFLEALEAAREHCGRMIDIVVFDPILLFWNRVMRWELDRGFNPNKPDDIEAASLLVTRMAKERFVAIEGIVHMPKGITRGMIPHHNTLAGYSDINRIFYSGQSVLTSLPKYVVAGYMSALESRGKNMRLVHINKSRYGNRDEDYQTDYYLWGINEGRLELEVIDLQGIKQARDEDYIRRIVSTMRQSRILFRTKNEIAEASYGNRNKLWSAIDHLRSSGELISDGSSCDGRWHLASHCKKCDAARLRMQQ